MFRRQPSNCEPVRRGIHARDIARALVFLAGVAAFEAIVWRVSPHADHLVLGVNLFKGAFGGALVGLVAAAQIRGPSRRPARPTAADEDEAPAEEAQLDRSTDVSR